MNPGQSLQLIPRPDNPYDNTAVEIRLDDGTMLGHVPRERSGEFFALVMAGRVKFAKIYSVQGNAPYIEIEVEFTAAESERSPSENSATKKTEGQNVSTAHFPRATPNPKPKEGTSDWVWWIIGLVVVLFIIAQ